MRASVIAFLCIIACGLVMGCGDEDSPTCPPAPDRPLAQITVAQAFANAPGSLFSVRIRIYYSATSDTLVNLLIDETDAGTTLTITAADPHFNDFVSMITNGVDDNLSASAELGSGVASTGTSGPESHFLRGGLMNDMHPDLSGAHITKIPLHIDEIAIIRQGGTTSFETGYRVVFVGKA